MKKLIALIILLCLAGTSTAFAYDGRYRGGYDGHYRGGYGGYHSYHHGHNGLGIALGVVGGLVLGSAIASAAAPPPAVVYERQYVPPPRICYQDQWVTGEWQYSRYYGRNVWVEYAHPYNRRVEVPCY